MDKLTLITRIESCAEKHDVKPGVLLLFFKLLLKTPAITTTDLVYYLEIPKTNLGRVLKFFEDLLEPKSQYVKLKTQHNQLISDFLNSENTLDEKIYVDKTLDLFLQIKEGRPQPKRELDQFLATPETVIKRALYLQHNNELYKRKILLLGDDDLTSVSIALLNVADKIQVVDIDSEVLNTIQTTADKYDLPIEVEQTDFRNSNLEQFNGQFDVVFTDPPYTSAGISLFLDKAIRSVRLRNSSSIYFCYGNSPRAVERTLAVQKTVLSKELALFALEKNFNQYSGAESIGNGSSLYGCLITPATKIPKSKLMSERIYTYE